MPPMEGLGAAASILQVADIGFEVGIALFKYAKKVAYAEKQLKELGDQVEANATCLKTVGTLLDDPETRALHTAKLYDDTRAVSRGCKEVFYELDKTILKLDDGGSKLSVGARLQWPLYSRKLADLLKVLKNYSDVLHLMLAVLHIVEGRRAATSKELQALGKSLRRLSISNASLSKSNENLVDMLYTNQQAPKKTDIDHASQMFLTNQRSIDAPNGDPAVSTRVVNDPPKTSPVKNQKRRSTDSTHDHLQRCMDSVQELANTIACAMSAWQGQEKNGSSDIHGSHAKLIADISELPTDLECETCRGRVSWSHFDLVKAASECLGTCTCVNRISSSHWRCCNYDPADTYEDSEPRWRETKPRRSRDAYSGRPRHSSMLENTRSGSSNPAPPSNRPTVVQGDFARASSPPRRSQPGCYIQPASSKEPKATRLFEHKKLYSVDDGGAKLVADVDLGSGGERYHKWRESGGRLVHKSASYDHGRKPSHASGKREKLLDDDNAFSYTDPASMCKDTEPRWHETRPRRGSVDCGGAIRERPVSMIESHGADPRMSTGEVGPPPSQRGWDKIQDLGRSRSTRDPVPHSPSRNRDRDESRGRYTDGRDPYYIAPRKTSADRNRASVIHRELGLAPQDHSSDSDPDRERRRREREQRQAERQGRKANGHQGDAANYYEQNANPPPRPGSLRASFEDDASQAPSQGTWSSAPTNPDLRRRASILDTTMDPGLMAQVIDNSASEKRENRVRIVDPPSDEEDKKPKGILKRPTSKYAEDPDAVREGVAPLKDANKKDIPPGARWTRIDRRLVNPKALEKSNERFEERQDFVIVLRVLTKEEIQKLTDRTRDIRAEARAQEDKHERRASRRRTRKDRDEYEDESSEDEYAPRKPEMLETPGAPSTGVAPSDQQERQREHARQRESDRTRGQERRGRDERRERDNAKSERRRRGKEREERVERDHAGRETKIKQRREKAIDDESPLDRQRDPYAELDRGLDFAFEGLDGQKPRHAPHEIRRVHTASPGSHESEREGRRRMSEGTLPIRPQPENNDRDRDRSHESSLHFREPARFKNTTSADEQYRHRMQQIQHELGLPSLHNDSDLERVDPNRERRRRQRELRQAERKIREANSHQTDTGKPYIHCLVELNCSERDEGSEMTEKRRERRLSKRTSSRVFKRPHSQSPNSDTEATDTGVANDRSGDTSMKRLRRRVQGPTGEVMDNNTKNRREDYARVADLLSKDPSIERVPQLSSQSSPRSPGYTMVEEEQHVSWLPASPSRTALAAEHPSLKRSHSQMVTGTGTIPSPLAPKLYDDEVEDLSPKHSQSDRDEAMESSSALQALLSRWLGDNADAVLPETA